MDIKDIRKAIHYLTLAANQNDLYAQSNLGLLYYHPQYKVQNINKAIQYLKIFLVTYLPW